jgi:hypothetical protein
MWSTRPRLKVAALCDGAAELWNLLAEPLGEEALGTEVHEMVDLWHLLEKLGRAAAVIHGSGSADAVVKGWRLRLLNSSRAARRILAELQQSGREHVQVGEGRPVHDAITYIENNGQRMDYATARRRGLPVGSGNVEATCKSLVDVRGRASRVAADELVAHEAQVRRVQHDGVRTALAGEASAGRHRCRCHLDVGWRGRACHTVRPRTRTGGLATETPVRHPTNATRPGSLASRASFLTT